MGKEKEVPKIRKIIVGIYQDEIATIEKRMSEEKHDLIGSELNGKDIRTYFGLKPTHREGIKGELKKEVSALSVDEQKELLEEIRKKKGISKE